VWEEAPVADAEDGAEAGFPSSDGPILKKRDIEAEERVLEKILGSLDERRARRAFEVPAEVAAAIFRIGHDWGRTEYAAELGVAERAELVVKALADPAAVEVAAGYLAHLQEHRAEFFDKLIHPTEPSAQD
jgi:hypothetical protein